MSRSFHRFIPSLVSIGTTVTGLLFASSALAIGISPPSVAFNDILRNTEQTRSISLTRFPNETGDINVTVTASGTGADFLVGGSQAFFIPANQERAVFPLKINPGNAADGTYNLTVNFTKSAPESANKKGAVSIVTGVAARVSATVTGEQHLSYSLVDLYARDTEVEAPLPTTYVVNNTGNVDWRPGRIIFHFTKTGEVDPTQSVVLEELETKSILAGNRNQRESVLLPQGLQEGDYVLSADFYYHDELVGSIKGKRPFHVYPKDTFKQFGEISELKTNKTEFSYGEKIQVDSVFKNTGQISVKSTTILMLKKKNSVIDLIRGATYDIAPLSEVANTSFIEAKGSGKYTIEAYVEFGSKRSPIKSVEISIRPRGWVIFLETALVMLGITALILFWARRHKYVIFHRHPNH